jgi:uncharacterized membrane protein YbhN (UPF0104 family)
VNKYSTYLRIGVSVVLLGVIAWRTDWEVVAGKFANLNWGLWLAAVGVIALAQCFSARRWQLFSVGGDVVRVWYLDGKSGRKLAAFASVFLERVNGLLVLIAVACIGAVITPIPLPWWVHAIVWSVGGCALLGIISLPLVQRWGRLPLERRTQLKSLLDQVHTPRVLGEATCMSMLVQVAGVISLWLIGMALGLEIPVAYYCILGPMVSLLTLLPISVNGMGVRELGTVAFLLPLNVHEDTSKSLAFLWFASGVAISLLGGLIYLIGAYPRAATNSANEGTNENGPVDRGSDQGRAGEHKQAA